MCMRSPPPPSSKICKLSVPGWLRTFHWFTPLFAKRRAASPLAALISTTEKPEVELTPTPVEPLCVTSKRCEGEVVPTPTAEPLSKSRELPSTVPLGVHFGTKLSVPLPVTAPPAATDCQVALPAASEVSTKLAAAPIPSRRTPPVVCKARPVDVVNRPPVPVLEVPLTPIPLLAEPFTPIPPLAVP